MRRQVPLLLASALLTGCTAAGADPVPTGHGPQVAVAAYPFAWLVRQVGGPDVALLDLVQGGAEPHDVELSPRQVADVQRSDLVVGLRGFQPALDDAVADRPACSTSPR